MSMYQRLQPYAPEVATLRTRGCNPMRQRLQPYVSQVLTVHDDPAAFAEAAARLLLDSAEWTAHSDASLWSDAPPVGSPRVAAGGGGEDLSTCTVVQLKEKLRDAGLPVSGRKAELVERLAGASQS